VKLNLSALAQQRGFEAERGFFCGLVLRLWFGHACASGRRLLAAIRRAITTLDGLALRLVFGDQSNLNTAQTSRLPVSLLINTPLQRGVAAATSIRTVSTVFCTLLKPLKRFEGRLHCRHPAEAGC
jgi:hypothetical protein